jgi:peptide/nickel transport system substrate-binding protein
MWLIYEPLLGVGGADVEDPVAFGQRIDNAITRTDTHVSITFEDPYGGNILLQILAFSAHSIICKSWAVALGDWPGEWGDYTGWVDYNDPEVSPLDSPDNVMCGTGPFMFDYWEPGVEWSVVKFDEYWGGWPAPGSRGFVTRATVKTVDEWATRKLTFLAGDSDFCQVDTPHYPELYGIEEIRMVYPNPDLAMTAIHFGFNVSTTSPYLGVAGGLAPGTIDETGIPPNFFTDRDLRKGFAFSFDYSTFIEDVMLNEALQPGSPAIAGLPYVNPAQPKYSFDLAQAEEYFKLAWGGEVWEKGFTLTATYNTGNEVRQVACEMMRDNVQSINPKFHVDVVGVDWPVYLGQLVDFQLVLFAIGWGADYPDPHNFMHPYMYSGGTFAYFQSYSNAHVDELIDEEITTLDAARRQEIFYELGQIYYDEVISLPVLQPSGRHWERTWVQGWYFNPMYFGFYFYPLWKEDLPAEDSDMNGVVDIFDIVAMAKAFGSFYVPGSPHPDWNSRADLNEDTIVDIFDVVSIAKVFGYAAPAWIPPS